MQNIKDDQMQIITGGGVSAWAIAGITAIITFVSGIIEGIVHPRSCAD